MPSDHPSSSPTWLTPLIESFQQYQDRTITAEALHHHAVDALLEFQAYFVAATDDWFTPLSSDVDHPDHHGLLWSGQSDRLQIRLGFWVTTQEPQDPPAIVFTLESLKYPLSVQRLWSTPVQSLDPVDFTPAVAAWSAWLAKQPPPIRRIDSPYPASPSKTWDRLPVVIFIASPFIPIFVAMTFFLLVQLLVRWV